MSADRRQRVGDYTLMWSLNAAMPVAKYNPTGAKMLVRMEYDGTLVIRRSVSDPLRNVTEDLEVSDG